MSNKMRQLLLIAAMVLLTPMYLFAGNTGKINGVVKDKDTGDPLPGVNIVIDGTTMGAATNAKGEFTIQNVPAGVYVISTSMISYAKLTKQNVRVLPDFTTRLDFDLTPTSVSGDDIIVTAERPLIQKDQTMTMTVTSSEEIKNLPVRGFQGVANLSVGIVLTNRGGDGLADRNLDGGTGNVSIRGGRTNETGVYIDGFQQNNLLTGASSTNVPSGSVEEVVVITGGFDAEYGRNKSGLIQVTTKSGTSAYSGNVEVVGDPGGLAIAESYGYNVLSAGIGGPIIPGNNRFRFFVSGEARNIDDAEPSVTGHPVYSLYDGVKGGTQDSVVWGRNSDGSIKFKKGARPDGGSKQGINSDRGFNLQGKFTIDVIPQKLRLDLSGNFSQTIRRSTTMDRLLTPNNNLKRTVNNFNIGGTSTYTIDQNSFVDFGINGFSASRDIINDRLSNNFESYYFFDTPSQTYKPFVTTGQSGQTTYNNDNLFFDINRNTGTYQRNEDKYIALKTNYTNQVNKYNQVKTGFDYTTHWVRNATAIDNTDPIKGIGNLYGYAVIASSKGYSLVKTDKSDLENLQLGPPTPVSFSYYAQNKLEYEGLVLRTGIRYDYFDPGTDRLIDLSNPSGQGVLSQIGKYTDANGNGQLDAGERQHSGTVGPEDYTSGRAYNKVSPRISVSFPVSEKTQFRMSYGTFFQQPNLQDLYIGPRRLERQSLAGGSASVLANPNLLAEQTTQYEVGFRRALTDKVAFDVTAYYKDVKGLINTHAIPSEPNALIIQDNLDEAVIKGMNLSLEMRRTGKFQGRLNYTLQSAKGTGSGETSGFRASWLGFADTKFNAPLNNDQTHSLNVSADVRNMKGEGPMVGGVHALENAGLNVITTLGSGLPYTPTTVVNYQVVGNPSGKVTARRNSQVQPWTFRIDLKADKTFEISDKMNVNVYVQVLNLLDRKNVQQIFAATGQPDDNGYVTSAAGANLTQREKDQYAVRFKDGLSYEAARQARLGILFNF